MITATYEGREVEIENGLVTHDQIVDLIEKGQFGFASHYEICLCCGKVYDIAEKAVSYVERRPGMPHINTEINTDMISHRVCIDCLNLDYDIGPIVDNVKFRLKHRRIIRHLEAMIKNNQGNGFEDNVYIIQPDRGGPVKIGKAVNVKKRVSEIQYYCPYPLKVMKVFKNVPATFEGELHRALKECRMHGEWFSSEVLRLLSCC